MRLILEKGHSRVPVYYEEPTNIIGLVLVISLLSSMHHKRRFKSSFEVYWNDITNLCQLFMLYFCDISSTFNLKFR